MRQKFELSRPWHVLDLHDLYSRQSGVHGPHPRPFGSLHFHIVSRIADGNLEPFTTPLEMIVRRNPSGYRLFFGAIKLSKDQKRSRYLVDSTYVIRVSGDYYEPLEDHIALCNPDAVGPPPPGDQAGFSEITVLDLFPGRTYPFPNALTRVGLPTLIRGHVQDANNQDCAAVQVHIVGLERSASTTTARGHWLLTIPEQPESDSVDIGFTVAGASQTIDGVPFERSSLQNSLATPTLLSGRVIRPGVDDMKSIEVSVEGLPGVAFITKETGHWLLLFPDDQPSGTIRVHFTFDGVQAQRDVPLVRGRLNRVEQTVELPG